MPTIETIAQILERHMNKSGDYETAIPSVSLHRRDSKTEPLHCIYSLGLGITVQGSKQILVNDKVINNGAGESFLTTIDQPVISHVTRANSKEPFLGILILLDGHALTQTASEMDLPHPKKDDKYESITSKALDSDLLNAVYRLVELLDQPLVQKQLAPLILQEINIRLLTGGYGPILQRLLMEDAPVQQIARAVNWIRQNFAKSIAMDKLAAKSSMSPSTFRQHFRNITGTSPLQFQKQLRLQEARQLMLNENYDAGEASSVVGYESASQFSREYSRLFGAPPLRDIQRLKS